MSSYDCCKGLSAHSLVTESLKAIYDRLVESAADRVTGGRLWESTTIQLCTYLPRGLFGRKVLDCL